MSYRQDLRDNRKSFMAELHTKYGRLPAQVEKRYLQKVIAIQNSTRGKFGELMGEITLTATGQSREQDIVRDTQSFDTPFGRRRIDVWDKHVRRAVEIKSGYTCLSKFVRNQIQKDLFLRDAGIVKTLCWHLLQGGSRPLLAFLEVSKISVEHGYPEFSKLPPEGVEMIEQSRSVSRGEIT